MNSRLIIYLCGKMGNLSLEEMNSWRKEIKEKLLVQSKLSDHDVLIINPVDFYNFEEVRHQSEEEIMNYDILHTITSDIVIVNLDGLATSDGSKIEIFEANYNHKIPVLAFGNKELYDNLHPWIKRNITRVEDNMQDIVTYIKDFYMI